MLTFGSARVRGAVERSSSMVRAVHLSLATIKKLTVGCVGTGWFDVKNGASLTVGCLLQIGNNACGAGTVNVDATSTICTEGFLVADATDSVGYLGSAGTATIDAGTSDIIIGTGLKAVGTVDLSGQTTLSGQCLKVGTGICSSGTLIVSCASSTLCFSGVPVIANVCCGVGYVEVACTTNFNGNGHWNIASCTANGAEATSKVTQLS